MKGKVEGDKDTVLEWIRTAKNICEGISFSESDFLDDITCAVPVFIKDGAYYRWSHKSLAEYFAAQYVCTEGKQTQEKLFTRMWEGGLLHSFTNVLDQIYDLDITAFRKYFILPVAREFSSYWENSYKGFAGQMSIEEINLRKSACFGAKFLISSGFNNIQFDDLNKIIGPYLDSSVVNHSSPSSVENVPFSVSFNQLKERNGKEIPLMIFSIPKRYEVVLSILETKRDALIQHKSKLEALECKMCSRKNQLKKQ